MNEDTFMIRVQYDDDSLEVDKVDIIGGFKMPSLEMTDLLGDVIYYLEEMRSDSWNGYADQVLKGIEDKKKLEEHG
jgi:hypothetical protein|tara:strand:+ start:120 stop:347 length:228 start_codon:yes stop_codon:yes gene_type:complete